MIFPHKTASIAKTAIAMMLGVILSAGCAATPTPQPLLPASETPVPSPMVTVQPPSPGSTVTATAVNTPTPTPQFLTDICSPLEGISIGELPALVTNPYATPRPGLDDGHHGTDFAYWSRGDRTTMKGLPIYAVLPGRVAAAISDRPPYGNFIMIETPLEHLSPAWQQILMLPSPRATLTPSAAMVCPTPSSSASWEKSQQRSLYILYAHMEYAPTFDVGSPVSCGENIGAVGTTGMSVNDHLHLEVRVGPSQAAFDQMAFYDTGATAEEMTNYCAWRVSEAFQLVDPMKLLSLKNNVTGQ